MDPASFWDQTFATFNAAMRGALKRRRDQAEQARDLALMTAYFSGLLSQTDWKAAKIPHSFPDWLAQMTQPQTVSTAERLSRFEALSKMGFDVQVNTRH